MFAILFEQTINSDGTTSTFFNTYKRNDLCTHLRRLHGLTYSEMMALIRVINRVIIKVSPTHRYLMIPLRANFSLEQVMGMFQQENVAGLNMLGGASPFKLAEHDGVEFVIVRGMLYPYSDSTAPPAT